MGSAYQIQEISPIALIQEHDIGNGAYSFEFTATEAITRARVLRWDEDGSGLLNFYIESAYLLEVQDTSYNDTMFLATGNGYRYGFNGMEKDDEWNGVGNSYDFGARIYDARLGRWLARDPLSNRQPNWSPYKAFKDNPLVFNDPDGRTEYERITKVDQNGKVIEDYRVVISHKEMTDGKVHSDADHKYEKYFNYEHQTTYMVYQLDDGTTAEKIVSRTENNLLGLSSTKGVFFDGTGKGETRDSRSWWERIPSFEGNGGTQIGGIEMLGGSATDGGTKYSTENDVSVITDMEAFLALIGGAKATGAGKNLKFNLTDEIGNLKVKTVDGKTGVEIDDKAAATKTVGDVVGKMFPKSTTKPVPGEGQKERVRKTEIIKYYNGDFKLDSTKTNEHKGDDQSTNKTQTESRSTK